MKIRRTHRHYARISIACILATLLSAYTYRHMTTGTQQEEPKVTPEAYHQKIAGTTAVLVYFSAGWCAVCPRFKPVIAEIEKEYKGKTEVLRIDTERDADVAKEFEINSLPLLILYKNGEKVWTNAGIIPIAEIRREMDCYL